MTAMHRTAAGAVGIAALAFAATAIPARADELVVPGQYASIKEALGAAVEGDVVRVEPGQYEEGGLVVPQGVTLWGAGPAHTELWADGNGPSITLAGDATVFGIWIHGGDPAIASDASAVSIWIDSVWIGPTNQTLRFHNDGSCDITIARSVVWSEVLGAELRYEATSEVRLHTTHWLGTGSAPLLLLEPFGDGLDDVTRTLVHNSLFENGALGLALSTEGVSGGHSVLVYNNVFIANQKGADVVCGQTQDVSFELSLFNNWFVEHDAAVDLTQCSNLVVGLEHHNGYFDNTVNLVGPGQLADSSFSGEPPMFVDAIPNDQHDDDYRLQTGSHGIDAGLGVPSGPNEYMDNDGTIPDVGAYGGPYGSWP